MIWDLFEALIFALMILMVMGAIVLLGLSATAPLIP